MAIQIRSELPSTSKHILKCLDITYIFAYVFRQVNVKWFVGILFWASKVNYLHGLVTVIYNISKMKISMDNISIVQIINCTFHPFNDSFL